MLEQLAAQLRQAIASGRYAEARELVSNLAARVPPGKSRLLLAGSLSPRIRSARS